MTQGQRTLIDYGSALAAVALAWLVRWLIDPTVGNQAPYATFVIAVIFTAWRSGLRPAVLVMSLGFVIAFFFFLGPRYEITTKSRPDLITSCMYLVICLAISVISEVLRKARQRADASVQEANAHRTELEREITERQGIEAALRQQQAWFRVTFFSIGDAVLTTDASGKVTYLNPVAEALTGWSQDDAAGQPLEAVFRVLNELTRRPAENPGVTALRENRVVGLANHSILIAKDGSERPVDDSAAPIRDDDDSVVGVVLVFRDVSERRRAERASRHLAAIVESSDDAILSKDLSGTILTWNRGAERLYGYTAAEVIGKSVSLLLTPGREDELPVIMERVKRGEITDHYETVRRHKDGTPLDVSITVSPVRDAEGSIVGASTIARNMGRQKQVEGEIRRLNRDLQQWISEFQTLLDVIPIGIAVTDDADCRRIWTNPTMARILRLPQDANASLSAPPAQRPKSYRVFQNGRELPVERMPLHLAVLGGREVRDMEIELRLEDGSVVNMLSYAAPLFDENGKTRGGIFAGIDITHHKQALEALQRNEARKTAILETSLDCIITIDSGGNIVEFNPAAQRTFGYTLEEAIGSELAELIIPPQFREQHRRGLVHFLATGQGHLLGRRLELTALRKSGEEFPVELAIAPIPTSGDPLFTANLRDITDRNRAELVLRESDERLRLALQAGRMGTWDWNIATGEVLWSASLESIHGLVPGTFAGTFEAYQQDIHPYDRDFVLHSLQQTLEHGEDHRLEYRLIWPDGSIHWVESRGKLFRDAEGRPLRMVGVCIDIDERERLEQELRRRVHELAEAEGRVRSVVNNVIDGIITINDCGTIEAANPAAERIFGYPAVEMVGQSVKMLMPEPDHSEQGGTLANYFRTGVGREMLGRRKDGSRFPMDLAVGEFQLQERRFFTGVIRDITERKRNEQTLSFLAEASEALAGLTDYESTLQKVARLAVPFFANWCSVDMLDAEGEVRRVASAGGDPAKVAIAEEINRKFPPDPKLPYGVAHILQTSQPELLPEITDELIVSVIKDEEYLRLLRALSLKSYIGVPLEVRGKTMGVITFMTAGTGRLYGPADLELAEEIARRACIAIENARLYAEVREADKRKDEFLATLAHELRNPLAPIRNALQLMQMAPESRETFENVRSTMERQIEQMVRLIDDLLDVSRITRNKLELRREQIDLRTVVQSAVETCRPLIDAAGHDFQLSLPSEPIYLHADFTRLSQIFANLLNNSCKYTEPGGKISLSAQRRDGEVEVRVCDTGIGIPRESLPRIFEMFTQVDGSLERSQGGLGIGLTLVRRLVEMHGGSVVARSDGPGKGSEFTVRLPVSSAPDSPPQKKDSPPPVAGSLLRRRILVVDDNKDAADTMCMILKMLGNEVRTAYDGQAALEAVDAFLPSLLLLDIGLPKMNGYDVAKSLRKKYGRDIVLAALTGWGQEEDRRRSSEAGFDYHLVKPANAAMLRNLLAGLPMP